MSSFNRQRNGQSRPPPARNRSSFHPLSTEIPHSVDPHYLDYLRSQAEQLNLQISELSHTQNPRFHSFQQIPTSRHWNPVQVSLQSSSRQQRSGSHRNPSREGSKWRFYAVKNGINGDDVYSSWGQSHPYCWDPSTEYFFPGCFCKGFNTYDDAWNFLLDILNEPDTFSEIRDSTIPPEPPEPQIPSEPDLTMDHPPQEHTHTSSHVVPNDHTDDESIATYDYNMILPPHRQKIPAKVHVQPSTTNDTTVSYDSNNATPFLSIGSDKALPKYSGTSNEDINEFLFKLRPFLRHESINDCHLDPLTNDTNRENSKHLASRPLACHILR